MRAESSIGFVCPMKIHLLVALLVAVVALAPLSYPGLLQTHNGFMPLYALMGEAAAQREVGSLPLGATALLVSGGLAPDSAWKVVEALAVCAGAIGSFALARRLYGDAPALVASVLYTLLPYPLMTLYVRGATGELLFLGLLPWLGLALVALRIPGRMTEDRTRQANKARDIAASALGLLVVGVAALVLWRLCVPYAPDPAQAQVYLFQVFSPRWDWGSRGDWLDAVPLQLGIVPLGLSVLALVLHPTRGALALGAIAAGCVLLSISPFSGWWPWAQILNAPWQMLGIAGLCLALLGALLVAREPQLQSLPALAAIALLSVLAVYGNLEARGYDFVPLKPPLARFADEAYLVDVHAPPLQAGTTVTVTLLWQDLGTFDDDYKVFVHVIDARQTIWSQRDAQPVNGTRPTSTWQRGELLRDDYSLTIPATAPHALQIELGLYRSRDGVRLATADGQDRVLIKPASGDE